LPSLRGREVSRDSGTEITGIALQLPVFATLENDRMLEELNGEAGAPKLISLAEFLTTQYSRKT
jgi:hypothetical protein